jgi:hypothetical protein
MIRHEGPRLNLDSDVPRRDTVLLEDLLQFRYQMIEVFNLWCQLIQKDLFIRLNFERNSRNISFPQIIRN